MIGGVDRVVVRTIKTIRVLPQVSVNETGFDGGFGLRPFFCFSGRGMEWRRVGSLMIAKTKFIGLCGLHHLTIPTGDSRKAIDYILDLGTEQRAQVSFANRS